MVLPMSKAVVAVVALVYAVGYWNAFFNAVLYINDAAKQPLQVVLRSFVLQGVSVPGQVDVGSGQIATLAVQMAVMVIALVPVVIVYPFIQRHFKTGVMRSEEHTSELQSRGHLVCRLLLEQQQYI